MDFFNDASLIINDQQNLYIDSFSFFLNWYLFFFFTLFVAAAVKLVIWQDCNVWCELHTEDQ